MGLAWLVGEVGFALGYGYRFRYRFFNLMPRAQLDAARRVAG